MSEAMTAIVNGDVRSVPTSHLLALLGSVWVHPFDRPDGSTCPGYAEFLAARAVAADEIDRRIPARPA